MNTFDASNRTTGVARGQDCTKAVNVEKAIRAPFKSLAAGKSYRIANRQSASMPPG